MSEGDTPDDQPNEPRTRVTDLLEQYGKDAMRLAELLAETRNDNYKLREKNRVLRQTAESLAGKVPGEGAVILSADDAAAWEAFKAYGTPADVEKALATAKQAQERLATLEREQTVRQAAEAHGYKASVLSKLPGLPPVVVKDTTNAEGTATRQALVQTDSGEQPLQSYIEQHYADFLPALAVEHGSRQQQGTPFPQQASNSPSARRGDRAEQFIAQQEERRKAQTNPLMKGT